MADFLDIKSELVKRAADLREAAEDLPDGLKENLEQEAHMLDEEVALLEKLPDHPLNRINIPED